MHIDKYSFGNIVVDGKEFTKDLILFPDRIKDNWWREDGHSLSIRDMDEIFKQNPEILIVGTGAYGKMDIPEETRNYVEERGIILVDEMTKKATEIFNEEIERGSKVVGAFHLTC